MRKIVLVFLWVIGFLFLPSQTFAENKFSTSLNAVYAVQTTGITHASFTVALKNLTDRYYPTSYSLQLGFSDISNIRASDNNGTISPVLKNTSKGQEVTFGLNHKAIGLGATETIQFSFDTANVASHNGTIWEVNIPGLLRSDQFDNFIVNITVPPSFGQPVFVKPNVGNKLTFTKDQLGQSGISLAFGSKQVFHFNLAYHVKNSQLFPVHTDIALPPNTSYQTISIDTISPKPITVQEDKDGNWLATYALLPSQELNVHVDGRAFLSLTPTTTPQTTNISDYLKPTTYWQSNNDKITHLAQQIRTPFAIYEYVVKTLHYDYTRVSDDQQRLGAVAVLQDPSSAVCLEFTDLFIALSRAAGIPAREIDGFAYTLNSRERPVALQKDILHAWPEYYDNTQKQWVMVDPTWENTTGGVDYFHTFDFDHIAFVIKGENPTYPVPAGGYKLPDGTKTQDVTVTFATDTQLPDPTMSFAALIPDNIIGGFPTNGHIQIVNTGNVLVPPQKVRIASTIPGFTNQTVETEEGPPFGTILHPITYGSTAILTNRKGTVTITLAGKQVTYPVIIVPFPGIAAIVGGGILASIFIITLFIFARQSRRLSVP